MDNFAAIDFETANNERTSVCSVGVVIVRDGKTQWYTNLCTSLLLFIFAPEKMFMIWKKLLSMVCL